VLNDMSSLYADIGGKGSVLAAQMAADDVGNIPGFQWTYDTYALAHGTGGAIVKQAGDTWFFITADYAFGHALERDTGDAVKAAGGKVLGAVRRGRVKSPIASISYRTYARPFRRSSAAPLDLCALCCQPRTAMTSASR
jgi:hypothetical protein